MALGPGSVGTTGGELKTVYLGFSESDERGSAGLYSALKEDVSKCGVSWQEVFNKVTSIVTDRESANTACQEQQW